MGLLTGSRTPSIFDVMEQPQPSALSRISGMLGGNQAYAQPPSPLPTPAPVQSGVRPGNLGGGPVPMGGSAPQPEPTPASTNPLIDALKS